VAAALDLLLLSPPLRHLPLKLLQFRINPVQDGPSELLPCRELARLHPRVGCLPLLRLLRLLPQGLRLRLPRRKPLPLKIRQHLQVLHPCRWRRARQHRRAGVS
jgi:hypothetical protein